MRLWGCCLSGHRRAEILVDPRRKPTLAAIGDGFLESRLSPQQKATLVHAMGGAP
jgi:hypothetical protein